MMSSSLSIVPVFRFSDFRYLLTGLAVFFLFMLLPDTGLAVEPLQEYPVPPPPFSEGIFPCSDCHRDLEVNTKKRQLVDEHQDIRLHHAEQVRWCLDCHDANDRDRLRLTSGATIPFTESYLLCGQCHGTIYRDWRAGVHGKRTGFWRGPKRYLLCAHCHNPHAPAFVPLVPAPPPLKPRPGNDRVPTHEKRPH
ncbi:MAG: hypothetical protein JXO49_06390 [Deltaproteobacteria bacterium]|nr:hypothetical protein [Candidatus Anaeroferrophillus wilburensis]MBN2888955.1 hypothetical protein [Deltaproteobacteria bacterium]